MFEELPNPTQVLIMCLIALIGYCFWPKDEDWDDDDDDEHYNDGLQVTNMNLC